MAVTTPNDTRSSTRNSRDPERDGWTFTDHSIFNLVKQTTQTSMEKYDEG